MAVRVALFREGWHALLVERRLPWRLTHRGGLWNTTIAAPLRLVRDRVLFALGASGRREDVTIVIPVRNRVDHRLTHTLRAIRRQDYPQELIAICIVDYDSAREHVAPLSQLCRDASAEYLRVENKPIWNKPHCFNVAIKRCKTKYLMTLDNDIILSPNYLRDAIGELQRNPFQVVYSQMLDLPQETAAYLANPGPDLDLQLLRSRAIPRTIGAYHESINVTLTHYLKRIRGYDENYTLWGVEDNDIAKRLYLYGLGMASLKDRAYYLHQWHPRFEALDARACEEQVERSWSYCQHMNTVVRNRKGWGEKEPRPTRSLRGVIISNTSSG